MCVCVSDSGVGETRLCFMCCNVVTGGGACVRGAACRGWYCEYSVVCG